MGAPALPQQGAAAAERLHRADALEDHRREHEQGRDGPAISKDPRHESSAGVGADRGESEQDANRGGEERPDHDLEEARVRRADSVQHVRPLPLKPDGRRADDRRHEVNREEVRHQVGDEDLLVEEPLEGDTGGRPSARTLSTTINQTKPVKTRARNGNAIRRGSVARTRRLPKVKWNPRVSWARNPVFGAGSW